MNIETLDRLESICTLENIIEAVGNDDDERIAGCIYRLMFTGKDSDLPMQRDALLDAVADYFDISDADLDNAKSVYDRDSHGDHLREQEKAA